MNTEIQLPNIDLLAAIAPAQYSAGANALAYEKLEPTVEKQLPYLQQRWEKFLNNKSQIEEEVLAMHLAFQYLLQTAVKANTAETPELKSMWSERYTKASVELYGEPDEQIATSLFAKHIHELSTLQERSKINSEPIESYFVATPRLGELQETSFDFTANTESIGKIVTDEYKEAFELFSMPDDELIDPEKAAELFSNSLEILAQKNPIWAEWNIELVDDNKLTVYTASKTIKVGQHRSISSAKQIRGLFAHELLVHAHRAVNGSQYPEESRMRKGLPGYLETEEGLGVYLEYAVTGDVPVKIVDRYVDTALALGQIGGKQYSRPELFKYTYLRHVLRTEASDRDGQIDYQALRDETWAYVNRIYRGTPGNDSIGVYTKDIVYYQGFLKIGRFINEQVADGKTPKKVLDYLLQGKFDPTNPKHTSVVEKYATKL